MTHGINKKELIEVSCKVVLLNADKTKALILVYDDGYYGLPGGHLERGETLLGAIQREINEELGIVYCGELTRLDFGLDAWRGRHDDVDHVKVILGSVGELDESVELNHEPDNPERVTQLVWMPIADAVDPKHYPDAQAYPDFIVKAVKEAKV